MFCFVKDFKICINKRKVSRDLASSFFSANVWWPGVVGTVVKSCAWPAQMSSDLFASSVQRSQNGSSSAYLLCKSLELHQISRHFFKGQPGQAGRAKQLGQVRQWACSPPGRAAPRSTRTQKAQGTDTTSSCCPSHCSPRPGQTGCVHGAPSLWWSRQLLTLVVCLLHRSDQQHHVAGGGTALAMPSKKTPLVRQVVQPAGWGTRQKNILSMRLHDRQVPGWAGSRVVPPEVTG